MSIDLNNACEEMTELADCSRKAPTGSDLRPQENVSSSDRITGVEMKFPDVVPERGGRQTLTEAKKFSDRFSVSSRTTSSKKKTSESSASRPYNKPGHVNKVQRNRASSSSASSRVKSSGKTSAASSRGLRKDARSSRQGKGRRKKTLNVKVILQREKGRLEKQSIQNEISVLKRVTCKNVMYFVLLYSALLCCRAAITTYIEGMTDELQKAYSFTDAHLNLIQGTQLIGLLASLIFVAFFGRDCHKPLLLACGSLTTALGTMVFAGPYFADKTSLGELEGNVGCNLLSPLGSRYNPNVSLYYYAETCQQGQQNSTFIETGSSCLNDAAWLNERQIRLSILCVGGFLIGLGSGLFVTSGFIYVEESGGRKNGPIFYGVFLSMDGLGHFLGACMTFWFLGYDVNLSEENDIRLPWIRKAWWLGFVILSVILFILSWLFLFFPKWIVEPEWSSSKRRQKLRRLTKMMVHEKEAKKRRRERIKMEKRRRRNPQRVDETVSGSIPDTSDVADESVSATSVSSASGPGDDVSNRSEDVGKPTTEEEEEDDEKSIASSNNDEREDETERKERPRRMSHGDGSGLGMILEEEDSHISRLPSCAFQAERDNFDESVTVVVESPIWPLHEETTTQSRVVTFANSAADAASDHASSFPGIISANRRRRMSNRIPRRQLSKKLGRRITALKRTILLPVFALSLIGTTLSAYLPAGYRSNVVKFVEVQFGQPAVYSMFYTAGLSYSIAEAIGALVGGIIVHKFRMSLLKQVSMIICLLFIHIIAFALIFPISCSGGNLIEDFVRQRDTLYKPVNLCPSNCSESICLSNGTMFVSLCHATCTQLSLRNGSLVSSNCLCASDPAVSSSYCTISCSNYGAFWVVLFVSVISHSMVQVSVILIFLRSVKEVDRHLALSIAVWIIVAAAFIPGVAIFQSIENSSCLASSLNCYDENTCLKYDINRYRYVIHGSNMAFQFGAMCFFLATIYFLRSNPVEPVGFRKEEDKSGVEEGSKVERRSAAERNRYSGKQSMMEDVQSRIASGLLANQPELMQFQSGSLPKEIKEVTKENDEEKDEGRGTVSSGDSVFLRDNDECASREEGLEALRENRIRSDQSGDSVFVSKDPHVNYGFETFDTTQEEVGVKNCEKGSGIRVGKDRSTKVANKEPTNSISDWEDNLSTVTESTRL